LHTYPCDSLIHLALATGIYSTTITNSSLQYYITTYGTPTFLLRYYIRATLQRILHADQLLLCEEYLISSSSLSNTSKTASSFVQTFMTDIELSNACLLRGLPTIANHTFVNQTEYHEDMSQALTEHLHIVAALWKCTTDPKRNRSSSSASDDDGVDNNDHKNHFFQPTTTMSDQDMEQIGLFLLLLPLLRTFISKHV
jgi:hypothetical protein